MSIIWITQETPHNFTSAEEFGEVVFVTNRDLHNHPNSLHNPEVLRQIQSKLTRFDPDNDFILPVGSPYISAMVFMMLGRAGVDKVRILRWSNRDKLYIPLYIHFSPPGA